MAYSKTTWVDEVLSGAERFDIKESGGTPIHENTQIVLASTVTVTQAGTALNATNLNHIENGIFDLDAAVNVLYDAPTTFNPTWTGLTGTLDLGNTFNYQKIGKLWVITGFFGGSGTLVSTYGTTYFTSPISAYLTGLVNLYVNLGASVAPTIVGAGAWHSNRVWTPTFNLSNAYVEVIITARES